MSATPWSVHSYEHGEGIRWDGVRGELLWVDIGAGRFLRAAPDAVDSPSVYDDPRPIGAVTPVASGGWLLAAGQGLVHLDEAGQHRDLATMEPPSVRMNDAACDPQGRFWAGSMALDSSPGAGSLHRLDLDGTVITVLRDLTISNGLGWSPDGSTMYLNDSGPSVTWAFDFDADSGSITNRRVLAGHDHGVCDGLTVDAEGFVWVALWGGSAVDRLDPTGRRVLRVEVPASQPSDCCLLDGTLVVTSARKDLAAPTPLDGRLFRAEVGVPGPPVQPYLGQLP